MRLPVSPSVMSGTVYFNCHRVLTPLLPIFNKIWCDLKESVGCCRDLSNCTTTHYLPPLTSLQSPLPPPSPSLLVFIICRTHLKISISCNQQVTSLDAAPRDGRSAGRRRPHGDYDASRPEGIRKQEAGNYGGREEGIWELMVVGRRR